MSSIKPSEVIMAQEDVSQIWFPELIDELRHFWRSYLEAEQLLLLAQELGSMLREIRRRSGPRSPKCYCRRCREKHTPHVDISVPEMIAGAVQFGLATKREARSAKWRWMKYCAERELQKNSEQVDERAKPS